MSTNYGEDTLRQKSSRPTKLTLDFLAGSFLLSLTLSFFGLILVLTFVPVSGCFLVYYTYGNRKRIRQYTNVSVDGLVASVAVCGVSFFSLTAALLMAASFLL